jgi:hypothetical protein
MAERELPLLNGSFRAWALQHDIPIRFTNTWRGSDRASEQCNLFYGLPSQSMRAWIDESTKVATGTGNARRCFL